MPFSTKCRVVKLMLLRCYIACSITWFGQIYIFRHSRLETLVEVVGRWRSSVRNSFINVLILKKFMFLCLVF